MPKFCANFVLLYTELPFLDRFAAAAADGFKAVEYYFPYDYPAPELAERLGEYGLIQVVHSLPAGDWAKGERGITCLPDRVGEFQDGVGRAIDYAKALGCCQLTCLSGIAPAGVQPEKVRTTLVDNLRFAAKELGAHGIRVLVENVNTRAAPGYVVNTTRIAESVFAEVGSDNLYLQYDVFHAQVMEGDLAQTFQRMKDRIGHIQIADNPGRHEPGTGEINYDFLFDFFDREGYRGWIGCEYNPLGKTSDGLGWVGGRFG